MTIIGASREGVCAEDRLMAAVRLQLARINQFWAIWLPESDMAEAQQILRNVARLRRFAASRGYAV